MKINAGEDLINKLYSNVLNESINDLSLLPNERNEQIDTYLKKLETVTKLSIEHNDLPRLKEMYYNKYVIKEEMIPDEIFYPENNEYVKRVLFFADLYHDNFTLSDFINNEKKKIIKEQQKSLSSWIDFFAFPEYGNYPSWFKYYCFQGMLRIGCFDKDGQEYTLRDENTIDPFLDLNQDAIDLVYQLIIKHLNDEKSKDIPANLVGINSFSKLYYYAIHKVKINHRDIDKYNNYVEREIINIYQKYINNLELTKNNLEFIYKINSSNNIYKDDPRLLEIISHRNKKADIIYILENREYFEGSLDLSDLKEARGIVFPNKYKGNINLSGIENNVGLILPNILEGNLFLNSLKETVYLKIPEEMYGGVDLRSMTSAQYISFPKTLYGGLNLNGLTNTDKLVLPEKLLGNLGLLNLKEIDELVLPKHMKGSIRLLCLTKFEKIKMPEYMVGNIHLESLTSAKGLVLPNTVYGNIMFDNLLDGTGIVFPKNLYGDLYLNTLTNIETVNLPIYFNGEIYINHYKKNEEIEPTPIEKVFKINKSI